MIKLGKREKALAVIFGGFVFLLSMEKIVFSPFTEKIEIIGTQIGSAEKKFGRMLYINSQRENIKSAYANVKPYIEMGRTEEDILSAIMRKIEEMVKESSITLLNMKPDTAAVEKNPDDKFQSRKVELNIEGSQSSIIKFLYKLENSKYPLNIRKIDLKIKDREKGVMEADLNVYFIYFI